MVGVPTIWDLVEESFLSRVGLITRGIPRTGQTRGIWISSRVRVNGIFFAIARSRADANRLLG